MECLGAAAQPSPALPADSRMPAGPPLPSCWATHPAPHHALTLLPPNPPVHPGRTPPSQAGLRRSLPAHPTHTPRPPLLAGPTPPTHTPHAPPLLPGPTPPSCWTTPPRLPTAPCTTPPPAGPSTSPAWSSPRTCGGCVEGGGRCWVCGGRVVAKALRWGGCEGGHRKTAEDSPACLGGQ